MSLTSFSALCILLVLCLAVPAQAKTKKEVKAHMKAADVFAAVVIQDIPEEPPPKTGLVSWYGPGFHRHRTASGERFNMNALTCASRDLPFGTLLEIKNLANQEKVIVRVNDRGPYVYSRILDLSLGAARKLGFHRSGQTQVEVREVHSETTLAEEEASAPR